MDDFHIPSDLHGVNIHFVGIKGTGMAALTEILCSRGAVITGSDVEDVFYTDKVLLRCGIKALPFSENNISKKLACVIYSSAYNFETNCELSKAKKLDIPCILYSQALGQLSKLSYSVGVAGVHGKTTTTGLVGTLLEGLNLPAQVLAGSLISSFGTQDEGSCTLSLGNKYFVAETCEYQRHFMSFSPKKIILTSVESDHQDYYPTYKDIRDAFVDYASLLPQNGQLIYCADDLGATEVSEIVKSKRDDIELVPYGITATGPWHISMGEVKNGRQSFCVDAFPKQEFYLSVPGQHLVLNATAAMALVCSLYSQENNLKMDNLFFNDIFTKLSNSLISFKGAKRRSEIIGRTNNVIFMDDYAHHPTAIKTTLAGFRSFYPNRKIIVDFMSHTYTRTAALLEEFANSFTSCDKVILHKIYGSARENASLTGVTGKDLYNKAKNLYPEVCYYEEVFEAEKDLIQELSVKDERFSEGYLFVTMGAGDNWKLGKKVYEFLSSLEYTKK